MSVDTVGLLPQTCRCVRFNLPVRCRYNCDGYFKTCSLTTRKRRRRLSARPDADHGGADADAAAPVDRAAGSALGASRLRGPSSVRTRALFNFNLNPNRNFNRGLRNSKPWQSSYARSKGGDGDEGGSSAAQEQCTGESTVAGIFPHTQWALPPAQSSGGGYRDVTADAWYLAGCWLAVLFMGLATVASVLSLRFTLRCGTVTHPTPPFLPDAH